MCVTVETAGAQAFRYQPQSGTGAAQANAFSAQADDASAVYYNPAGMTQLRGVHWSSTIQFIGASVNFRNAAGQTAEGDPGGTIALPPLGSIFVTANVGDLVGSFFNGLVVGIGVNTPYALKSRYGEAAPFNTAATSSAMPMLDIKPTIAYQLTDRLSVGVGADIYTFASFFGDGHAEQRLIWPGGGGIPAGASVEFNGKGTGVGMNGSLFYRILTNADGQSIANIGLVYRSHADIPLHGLMLVNGVPVANTKTSLTLPPMYSVAVAVWPIRDRLHEWKLELDVEYVAWKTVNNLDIQLSNGLKIPQPAKWKTAPVFMLGTEFKWLRPSLMPNWHVALRSGYTYTQSQVPDMTFTPGIPSLNSHTIAAGVGLTCTNGGVFAGIIPCGKTEAAWWMPSSIGADASFQALIYEDRNVQGNYNPTVNGMYSASFYLGALSLRMAF